MTGRGAIGAIALLLGGFILLVAVRFGGDMVGYGIATGLIGLGAILLLGKRD